MKVETPQILWNSECDKGINAALNSISILESGLSEHTAADDDIASIYGHVMVTAGNTPIINLWKLSFPSLSGGASVMSQKQALATKTDYLCSLTRQELSVNTVAFSPDGLHLATGGEAGAIVVWSVPPNKRGNGNGRHYWSTLVREQDLNVRIVSGSRQGICDISWSTDSKRFIAGTIDHCVFVCEDVNYDANQKSDEAAVESNWQIVYRNSEDHTQYVQGVAYDPLGVYLASMGSDRTVRVFPRKTPPKGKKKVLRPANNSTDFSPSPEHQQIVRQLLTESKLELSKSKVIKFRRVENALETEIVPKPPRCHLYADESTMESFFRRLSWTSDGAYLVTPAALWRGDDANEKASPSFATYLFARHKFEEPCKVLSGLEKPSLVIRPSPVFYTLPGSGASTADPSDTDSKENESPLRRKRGLPYRSVFAVLTTDSILVYDTHHTRPLSIIRGLHYASLSDCQWSADGLNLVVSSIDGYITFVSFEKGELGEVYGRAQAAPTVSATRSTSSPLTQSAGSSNKLNNNSRFDNGVLETPRIPPCEPGQCASLEAPPSKRPKKTRIAPTLISTPDVTSHSVISPSCVSDSTTATTCNAKRPADDLLEKETTNVGEAVTKLTLNKEEKPKKKKRIQPLLVSAGN